MSLTKELIDQETLVLQGGERGVIDLHLFNQYPLIKRFSITGNRFLQLTKSI